MITVLLEKIIQILEGWIQSFSSHAQHVEDKLDSLDQTASDIETNTDPIPDIRDNTAAVITPIQNIKSNTDSIKTSSQTSANNTTAVLNNISTLSTNTGRAAAFAEDCANNTLDIKDKVTTIASDTTQIRTDSDNMVIEQSKIYDAVKWLLSDKYIETTESGASPFEFDTDVADDLISCKVGLFATQSGSGDPAPDNVRTISGYSSMGLTVNGSSITIALGDTYYGGYLDVTTGILIITWGKILLSDLTWQINTSEYSYPYFYQPSNWNARAANKNYFCEIFTSSGALRSQISDNDIGVYNNTTGLRRFCIRCDSASDLTAFNSLISGYYLAYELATPITVSLTAQQIAAIKGINTISSDTNGDIEVTYKESIKHYLDKQDN